MPLGEAARLARLLIADPSSQVGAAVAGWDYPLSREALTLADLLDIQHASKAKKRPAPYPRPWSTSRRRYGRTALTRDQLRAILEKNREG